MGHKVVTPLEPRWPRANPEGDRERFRKRAKAAGAVRTSCASAALDGAAPLPGAVPLRDSVARALFFEWGLSCADIAALRWTDCSRASINGVLVKRKAGHGATAPNLMGLVPTLVPLQSAERCSGYGGALDYVIRFRAGAADAVSRANAVRRVVMARSS
jgi:hypothetical protein